MNIAATGLIILLEEFEQLDIKTQKQIYKIVGKSPILTTQTVFLKNFVSLNYDELIPIKKICDVHNLCYTIYYSDKIKEYASCLPIKIDGCSAYPKRLSYVRNFNSQSNA